MRSKTLTLFALSSTLLFARAASADESNSPPRDLVRQEAPEYAAPRTGFQLGVRSSIQIPAGSLGGGENFSDLVGMRAHLAFDIGSKLSPYFFFGGYVGFGYGNAGGYFDGSCGDGSACTAESVDSGVVAIVTFMPGDLVDPWVGVTAGYEIQGMDYGGATGLFTGISPSLLAGFDFRLRNAEHKGTVSIGPYGGVTFQKYLTGDVGGSSMDTGTEPFHMWFHLGVRVTLPS